MATSKSKHTVEPAAPAADKKKALETAMAQIERTYGKGSIMRLGESAHLNIEAVSTGSLALDIAGFVGQLHYHGVLAVQTGHGVLLLGGDIDFLEWHHVGRA